MSRRSLTAPSSPEAFGSVRFSHHRRRCARAAPAITPEADDVEFPILGDLHCARRHDYLARPIGFHETAPSAIFDRDAAARRFQRRAGRAVSKRAPGAVTRAFRRASFGTRCTRCSALTSPKNRRAGARRQVQRATSKSWTPWSGSLRPARLHADDRRRFAARADRMAETTTLRPSRAASPSTMARS